MVYEVIKVKFRTELHARWSVFFDHLRVPWAYEPVTFRDSAGSPRTPAFWLPEQRIWSVPRPPRHTARASAGRSPSSCARSSGR
ncbi:hypothetical protein [Streptomyces buecherae]|uniref:hypothetical protein n=1 Tax=Streptomyces buecherae TaxID=2763006 RepID=UPI003653FBCF